METIQMFKSIFGLRQWELDITNLSGQGKTYIHNIIKYHKGGSFCLLLIPYAYLPDAAIPSKEVVQVFPSDLVVQVFDEEYTIGTWRQF